MNKQMREVLIETYLDYRNNYLTVELFAEHNGLHQEQAQILIALSRSIHDSKHPES